jgi:hypothetical protein
MDNPGFHILQLILEVGGADPSTVEIDALCAPRSIEVTFHSALCGHRQDNLYVDGICTNCLSNRERALQRA